MCYSTLVWISYFNNIYLLLQMKLPQIQKIMMEFEKQSEIMDMKEEMMNDAIDDAMGDEDDEEERYISYFHQLSRFVHAPFVHVVIFVGCTARCVGKVTDTFRFHQIYFCLTANRSYNKYWTN